MLPCPPSSILVQMQALAPEFVSLRRQLHAQPELAFAEHQTAATVAALLKRWGYRVSRGLGGTGVVGQLRRGRGGRRLGLRADMDALPIQEQTGLPYASQQPGRMHACGHDGHTAILLCAARWIADSLDFEGTLNLIFQPAEEAEGGALKMVADGLFEHFPCDEIYALHNAPGLPLGQVAISPGPIMASFDRVTVRLKGKGAHGAMPHQGIDPLSCAASLLLGLQTLITRELEAGQSVVITVGSLACGEAYNVVPEEVLMRIGVRTLQADLRQQVERRLTDFVQSQAQSYRLQAEIDYRPLYPVLVNHVQETEWVRQAAQSLLGAEAVVARAPSMGSEDFAYLLQHCPGAYLRLGTLEDRGQLPRVLHHPAFDFNDQALPIGAALWAHLVQRRLVT